MKLTDERGHLICENCSHPLYHDTAFPNKGKDEKGTYIVCAICGNKNYLNKEKEL